MTGAALPPDSPLIAAAAVIAATVSCAGLWAAIRWDRPRYRVPLAVLYTAVTVYLATMRTLLTVGAIGERTFAAWVTPSAIAVYLALGAWPAILLATGRPAAHRVAELRREVRTLLALDDHDQDQDGRR